MRIKEFAIERYFAEYEFSVKYLLSSSDCEPLGLSELLRMADKECLELWDELKLSYSEAQGMPMLREEIAKLYQGISAEQVLVLTPEEGIYISMQTMLEKGDQIVTTYPAYQSLYEISKSIGCQVSHWIPDGNHQFHIEDLNRLISDQTKMLVINFPHNPTGALLSKEDQNELIELCRKHNILLFSDEMYRYLEYLPKDRLKSACEVFGNSITLCGMSKSFALPGLRLGWLIIPDQDRLKQIMSYKDYTTICQPTTSEVLAIIGLRSKERIIRRNLERIKRNIELMEDFTSIHPAFMRWIPPKAGSIAFPEIFTNAEIEDFCRCAAKKKNVMILPSSIYDYPGKYIRFGLGRKGFKEGLDVLETFIK